jgi:Na+/citrate or Na+/malate symporter
VQRIKEIALNAINGQAALTDTNKKAASSKKVKIAALITAAALILSTTVYAMGSIGAFEMFFPDSMKVLTAAPKHISQS